MFSPLYLDENIKNTNKFHFLALGYALSHLFLASSPCLLRLSPSDEIDIFGINR